MLQVKSLDPATTAIRDLCKSELVNISQTGAFSRQADTSSGSLLWAMLAMLSRYLHVETQSIEGLNSIVKLLGRRCPNISLELLSSRLTIKRLIGLSDAGVTGCGKRWSHIKAAAEREVLELSEHSGACMQVLCDADRWEPPPAVEFRSFPERPAVVDDHEDPHREHLQPLAFHDLLDRGILPNPADVPKQVIDWAKSYNLGWKWTTGGGKRNCKPSALTKIKQHHTSRGFGVLILPTVDLQDDAFYIVTEYFSHSVTFARLKSAKRRTDAHDQWHDCVLWAHDRSDASNTVESTLLFATYFEACSSQGHKVPVRACFLAADLCNQLFQKPGWLPKATLIEQSVLLFQMTGDRMKGVPVPKQKKQPKPKAKAQAAAEVSATEGPNSSGGGEQDADASEAEAEAAYVNDEYGLGNLFDHESESQNAQFDSEEIPEMNAAADHTTMELKTAIAGQKSNVPSASQLSLAAQELAASSTCAVPAAEMEEEALLLLIRQMKKPGKSAGPLESPSVSQLEGVGDAVISQPSPDAGCESDDSAASQPNDDVHWRFLEDAAEGNANLTESDVSVLCSWLDACVKTLAALREVSSH